MSDDEDNELDEPAAVQYLGELLRMRDKELAEAREENRRLERELNGSLNGWFRHESFDDDGKLPVPRLEMTFIQVDGWNHYEVVYRLVMKHLLDHLVAIPLGTTQIRGGYNNTPPDVNELPFRDGAHAMHDSAHLGLPLYKLMPGEEPRRLPVENWENAQKKGRGHRRELGDEDLVDPLSKARRFLAEAVGVLQAENGGALEPMPYTEAEFIEDARAAWGFGTEWNGLLRTKEPR